MSEREAVTAPGAPPAVGPYSHAVRVGELLFCSGQIPLDPQTGELVGASAAEQARKCLANLQAVCEAAGTSLARAVRLTVYVTDMGQFAAVNEVYGSFFAELSGAGDANGDGAATDTAGARSDPARVTVGVAALPKGAQVEIDAIVAV